MTSRTHGLADSDRASAAAIRAQLALRFNTNYGCWEVYSTIHGTGIFKWFKVSENIAGWYAKKFEDIRIEGVHHVDTYTGAFSKYDETLATIPNEGNNHENATPI